MQGWPTDTRKEILLSAAIIHEYLVSTGSLRSCWNFSLRHSLVAHLIVVLFLLCASFVARVIRYAHHSSDLFASRDSRDKPHMHRRSMLLAFLAATVLGPVAMKYC